MGEVEISEVYINGHLEDTPLFAERWNQQMREEGSEMDYREFRKEAGRPIPEQPPFFIVEVLVPKGITFKDASQQLAECIKGVEAEFKQEADYYGIPMKVVIDDRRTSAFDAKLSLIVAATQLNDTEELTPISENAKKYMDGLKKPE